MLSSTHSVPPCFALISQVATVAVDEGVPLVTASYVSDAMREVGSKAEVLRQKIMMIEI